MRRARVGGLALILSCSGAMPVVAQAVMPPLLSVGGGVMRYTLGQPRDGAAAYEWYRTADGDLRHAFIPELQLQFQAGPRTVQPYIGGGGGIAFSRVDSTTTSRLTASAAAGIRIMLGSWGVAGEARFRSLHLFDKGTRELTISIFRQLE